MQFFLRIKKYLFFTFHLALLTGGLYACASIGSPSGGDYDVEPPKFTGSDPAPNSIRFEKKKITLLFDEYISIDKPSEKVIITPPQKKMPVIKAVGKKITVELKDSLFPNTTYTFDFTNGIIDNNEQNPIEGFAFAFSTGDVIDSLEISGLLLNAEDLEPMPNVMIGIHSDLSDSAFTTLPFARTSQTNERGRFRIRNVAPGTYHIFALNNDQNHNFRFDQAGEVVAFDTTLIVPSFEPAMRTDTIWKDSLNIDTIKEVHYTRFTPDDIVLFLFKENSSYQYLSKTERTDSCRFSMVFNSSTELPPAVRLLDENENEGWYVPEISPDKKTFIYWITDSTLYKKDTLIVQTDYLTLDTLNNPITKTDTIKLTWKKKEELKKKKKEDNPQTEFLAIDITPSGNGNIFDTLKFLFSEPVLPFDPQLIHIQQRVDTLWKDREYPVIQDSLNPRMYYVNNKWSYRQEFQILIDSASIVSIYGKHNQSIDAKFTIRAEEEYAHLYITPLTGIEGFGFGQLLDAGEKIIRESPVENGELIFENLDPGKYYLRYIEDINANGQWDTGNYAENRQPERVFYYPGFFELKSYMELEQSWNVTDLPVEKQKPLEIIKNKPKEKQPRKNNNKNDTSKNSNTQTPRNTGGMQGLPRR
jgi:hypothetical protein